MTNSAEKQSSYLHQVYEQAGTAEHNTYDQQLADLLINNHTPFANTLGGRFLDIGCGTGKQAFAFSKYFKEIYGIDQYKDAQAHFESYDRTIELSNVNLENESLPYKDGFFDLIFTKSVIEHVHNTDHFLSEARRVLSPKGRLIILTPSWKTQWRHFFDDYTHVKPFTETGLKRALNCNGLNIHCLTEFYQLPWLWKRPGLKFLCQAIALLPESMKWKDPQRLEMNKTVRFSKETMLLAVASLK